MPIYNLTVHNATIYFLEIKSSLKLQRKLKVNYDFIHKVSTLLLVRGRVHELPRTLALGELPHYQGPMLVSLGGASTASKV